ncbi:hypothetical protein GEMMAAP_05335 [Gemmatimonas phototrophica]|uniref:Uncharacterized protein n=1 Tax=Gemmatimonas phototrophica TaxID=1379270 RepID=A0A143BHA8_9BACT|nr:hypothetical protein GEMMAAP_05335 [Gemmatimonas phototrophica]
MHPYLPRAQRGHRGGRAGKGGGRSATGLRTGSCARHRQKQPRDEHQRSEQRKRRGPAPRGTALRRHRRRNGRRVERGGRRTRQ